MGEHVYCLRCLTPLSPHRFYMRVCIIEDDPLTRRSLCTLLAGEPRISQVTSAGNGTEALSTIAQHRPDVALVDLGLPDISGAELIAEIKERWPRIEIMAYTVHDDRATVFAAIKAGATGYLLKGSRPVELVEALYELYEGGAPLTPKIARAVLKELRDQPEEPCPLTEREIDVLAQVSSGRSYRDVADLLGISPHTVHTHIKNIYDKLHVKNRRQALAQARKLSLI